MIWNTPELLLIHPQSFRCNYNYNIRHFPITGLDLSSFVMSEKHKHEALYDLYAVCNRATDHCTAAVKSLENEQWYRINDSSVCKVQVDGAVDLTVSGYLRRVETSTATVVPMCIIDVVVGCYEHAVMSMCARQEGPFEEMLFYQKRTRN